uniref:WGS project CBME000000000 data, contig CS3487_c000708 n=1 Tax=Fusarium pseudograminearum CS3487 TaxID=1318458 RepID=A0A096PDA6_FUSPS|nr:unnamed protein product [Fusarium pseudograminearum CS3487]
MPGPVKPSSRPRGTLIPTNSCQPPPTTLRDPETRSAPFTDNFLSPRALHRDASSLWQPARPVWSNVADSDDCLASVSSFSETLCHGQKVLQKTTLGIIQPAQRTHKAWFPATPQSRFFAQAAATSRQVAF